MALLRIAGICRRNEEVLRDHVALADFVRRLVYQIGMRPVGEAKVELYEHWPGMAPSLVQFLEESGIYLHTYPEHEAIQILLDSCKVIPNRIEVALGIMKELDLALRQYFYDPSWSVDNILERPQAPYLWPRPIQEACGIIIPDHRPRHTI